MSLGIEHKYRSFILHLEIEQIQYMYRLSHFT